MGIIGSAFVGYTRVYGVGDNRVQLPFTDNGIVAWYDASTFTNGDSVWVDSSGKGNDLVISGALLRADLEGPYINTNFATDLVTSTSTSLLSGNTDITVVTITRLFDNVKPYNFAGMATWGLGDGELSNYVYQLRSDNCNPSSQYAVAGMWHNGNNGPRVDGTYVGFCGDIPNGRLEGLNSVMYAYRASSVFDPVTPASHKISSAGGLNPRSITDNFSLGYWRLGGDFLYDFGAGANIRLGKYAAAGNMVAQRYGVAIIYNRQLTDSELEGIYDYYSTIYTLPNS